MKRKQCLNWCVWVGNILLLGKLAFAQAAPAFTFNHALKVAMQKSPLIRLGVASIHSANGQLIQSKTYPNPSLDVTTENIAGSGAYHNLNAAETTVMIAQTFPLGGKRQANQIIQKSLVGLSKIAFENIRFNLYVQLGSRYIDVLYAKNWLHTTSSIVRLNQEIVRMLRRKIKAGSGSPLDLMTAQIQLSQSKIARRLAHQMLTATWKRLVLLIGKRDLPYQRVVDRGGLPHRLLSYQTLVSELYHSPGWQAQNMKSNIADKRVILARKQAWPDLTVGLGARYFSDTHDNSFVVEFSLPLPVYNRNQGNVMSRLADYNAALSRQQQKMINLKSELSILYQRARSSQYKAHTLLEKILPRAKEAVKIAKKGYFEGRYPYVTLANAQATLLQTEKQYWRSHTDFDKALIELRGLLGVGKKLRRWHEKC